MYAIFNLDNSAGNISSVPSAYVELQIGDVKTKVPLKVPTKTKPSPIAQAFLSKLAAKALIRQLESDSPRNQPRWNNTCLLHYQYDYSPEECLIAREVTPQEQNITDISLKYGVLSQYVSLIAVESRSLGDGGHANQPMQLREVPIQRAQMSYTGNQVCTENRYNQNNHPFTLRKIICVSIRDYSGVSDAFVKGA